MMYFREDIIGISQFYDENSIKEDRITIEKIWNLTFNLRLKHWSDYDEIGSLNNTMNLIALWIVHREG